MILQPLDPQTLQKIRQIEANTKRLVNNIFAGKYKSVFKGRGMEFSEIREYVVGDDVRRIDWNVTARTGNPFVKLFVEEREMTVVFLIDASASSQFGTFKRTKSDLLAEVAAILAFSAIHNGDRVGLLIFTDEIECFIKPKKGRRHVLHVIHEILTFKPKRSGTSLSVGLRGLNDIFRRRSTVFFFSDFLADGYEKDLRIAHRKHDIIAMALEDRIERDFPAVGLVNLEDSESGEIMMANTTRPAARLKFKKSIDDFFARRDHLFNSSQIDHLTISTDQSYVDALVKFFRQRERRLGG